MTVVQERYTALPIAADSSETLTGQAVAGFLCKTGGTITVVDAKGKTVVDAFPVTAGFYYPLPFYLQGNGGVITTGGGASGTLAL